MSDICQYIVDGVFYDEFDENDVECDPLFDVRIFDLRGV